MLRSDMEIKFRFIFIVSVFGLFTSGCLKQQQTNCTDLSDAESIESCMQGSMTESTDSEIMNSQDSNSQVETVLTQARSLNPADAAVLNEIDVLNEQLFTPNGDNAWLRFDNISAASNTDLTVRFARASVNPDYIDQMILEVRGDTSDGTLLGVAYLGDTGGWESFQTKTISLTGFQGRVYLKFVGLGGVNISDIRLLDQISNYAGSLSIPQSPINACINLGGSLEAPRNMAPEYWGLQIQSEDLTAIADAGFDSIRLPVKFSDYAERNPPYAVDPLIFQITDQIIDWAFANELKVVLDMHLYDELFLDAVAEQDRFISIWGQIAEHYKNWWDTHLIFEIINEPNDESDVGLGMTITKTDELNRLVLNKIRQSNPDRWVVLGTGQFGTLDGLLMSSPPQDPKVMLSLHYYEPFDFTHQGAEFVDPVPPFGISWGSAADRQTLSEEFNLVESRRRELGMPLFLGEYGVIRNANTDGLGEDLLVPDSDRARWIAQVTQEARQRGYGYCYWDYATSYRAYDKSRQAWIPEIIDALR